MIKLKDHEKLKSLEEIDEMIRRINVHINKYEHTMARKGFGSTLVTMLCYKNRNNYAGWLAQRNLLMRIKKWYY